MKLLLAALLAAALLPAQRTLPRNADDQAMLTAAVATFDGTLKVLAKKELVLEVTGEQTLTIELNKKTQYARGKKAIAAKDVRVGALVMVEARRVMNRLEAVRVVVKDTTD